VVVTRQEHGVRLRQSSVGFFPSMSLEACYLTSQNLILSSKREITLHISQGHFEAKMRKKYVEST
jgi:hypothetical protein